MLQCLLHDWSKARNGAFDIRACAYHLPLPDRLTPTPQVIVHETATMKELHEALTYLGPVDWNEVPTDDLKQFASACLTAGELIINSVPPNPDGTPFNASKASQSKPNQATSHQGVTASEARSDPPHEDHVRLQKSWGKPYKFKKEQNPHNVALYKMAGNDRHGAWFARRSVHEGIGYDRFKRAMMREFSQALTVQGEPGAGAVRGIAADRRLERTDIPGLGKLEVYELSAAFPGPVTPRDFVALVISSDSTLSDKSAVDIGGNTHVPRHFMVLSKPVAHPDAPSRSGLVRGQYESVEVIREIPLSTAKSTSTTKLVRTNSNDTQSKGTQGRDANASDEPELNPVEWIMVTRSDPGGGIPRFLVERGTPEAMLGDLTKFFDWACALDEIPHPDDDLDEQRGVPGEQVEKTKTGGTTSAPSEVNGSAPVSSETSTTASNPVLPERTKPAPAAAYSTTTTTHESSQGGYLSGFTNAIEAGIEAYAPASVSGVLLQHLHPEPESSDDSSDTSSMESFLSAEELRRVSTAPEVQAPDVSTDNLSIMSGNVSEEAKNFKGMSHHEKEVLKLVRKREKLDQQLAKKRLAEQQKIKEAQEKDNSESGKTQEKIEQQLKKTEEKHRREVEKLEAKKAKEERKAEEKRKKKDDRYKLSLVSRERDDFRSQADLLRRENSLLRNQVADLQTQNTLMAQKLGALGGREALKEIDEACGRSRSTSIKSTEALSSSTATTTP